MEFVKKNINIIILIFFTLFCLYKTGLSCTNILIDVGREVYYPSLILDNKVLYKDIFCIYGPFSYLFNSFFYKILGQNLNTLQILGSICAISIIFFTYNLSKKFLSKFTSFVITFFIIATGVLSVRIFNFILPYSYAILYGILLIMASIYFLLKYIENKKELNLIIASILGGFAISSKYDFLPYILILFFFIFKFKSYKSFLSFLISLFSPYLILILQGAGIKDFINALFAIENFSNTTSLKTFYITQGVYYTKRVWMEWFMEIFNLSVPLFLLYFGCFNFINGKIYFRKLVGIIGFLIGIFLIFIGAKADSYLFLTFFTAVFFVFNIIFKHIKKDSKKLSNKENIFIISSILVSLKSLFGLSHMNYGLYFLPLILISFFILAKNSFTKNCNKLLVVLLFVLGFSYFYQNFQSAKNVNYLIQTNKGSIKTIESIGKPTKEVIDFINNLNEHNPKIMIYPEGLMINFLVNKKTETENFYNSLIPLYVEGFGEEKIVEKINNFKPDYIVISNMKLESYNEGAICETYAKKVCEYIDKNYNFIFKTKSSKTDFYKIYKLK